ncbi:tubulin nucleotide-binding domain-like protein [Parathielavia appendiculata]|uniref:Tubulin nucleotide-binding domain-like protein n=1 Tax=Parathielavia appendiculata TaxID=2587402 RepID=A0AAN6U069_9PEZI|nr:tubulin nucleotide-binding domain-like protein [Parathielavia appendiculata]
MHEIITLQLGQQANYLATHFWNTQESYFTYFPDQPDSPVDHDIHFRPGLAPDGTETYMPRTVIYDLKGAFGTLRKINALYDVNDDSAPPQALWQGQPIVHRSPPIPESPYTESLNLGLPPPRLTPDTVRYFSDYSRVFYHPRSVVPLSEHDVNSAVAAPIERHATGEELFADLDREHDLLDRDLRPFVEEADHMQGVQVFAGFDDAWGGFASRYVERVRDEYGKVGVWVWGLQAPVSGVTRDKILLRLANKARAMTEVYKQASIMVPLAVPERRPGKVQLDLGSHWHTSALLAVAVESAMLPTRLKDPVKRETLGGMAEVLNTMGKQSVAGLQMSFARPEAEAQNDSRQKELSEEELSEGVQLDIRFAPSDQLEWYPRSNGFDRPRVFSQLLVARGYGDEEAEDVEMDEAGRRVRRSLYEPVTKSYNTALRFPLLDSFPEIFRGDNDEPLSEALNITCSISTDSSVSTKLKQLRSTVIRSISLEDRETLGNELMEMADEYHEGWSSGSDEGEDD